MDDAPDPFDTVEMLGRWPVRLPAYRVEHCAAQPNWEEGRLLSMHAHLKPGMVLYDVGSEHSDLTICYDSWLGDDGGVVVIEGSDKFWPVIRATWAANERVPVACWAGFASDRDAPESERTPSWSEPCFSVPQPDGSGWPSWADGPPVPHHGFKSVVESGATLPNIRIDTLATMTRPPDAITLDTEGSEGLVLRGAERVLREHRPLVWTSVHEALLFFDYPEWPGMTTEEVLPWFHTFMADYGYRSQFLERNHETHVISWPEERTDFDPFLGVDHLRDVE